jgi:hypothetical protein
MTFFFVFVALFVYRYYQLYLEICFRHLKRAGFRNHGAPEGKECLEVLSSTHDSSACRTVFNHPFSTRPFGGTFFSGSHSTASAFLCHVHSPPFVGKVCFCRNTSFLIGSFVAF